MPCELPDDWKRSQYESEHGTQICDRAGRTRADSDRAHKHHHTGWSKTKRKPFVHAPAHSVLHPAVLRANVYAHTREECEEKLKVLIAEMKAELAELKRQKGDRH